MLSGVNRHIFILGDLREPIVRIPSRFPTSRLPTKGAICRWGILISSDIAHPNDVLLFVLKAYLGSVLSDLILTVLGGKIIKSPHSQ